MIKAIILDMGGVVLNKTAESLSIEIAHKLGLDEKEFSEFYYAYKPDMLSGKMRFSEFSELLKEKFKIKKGISSLWAAVYLEHLSINSEVLALIKKLRVQYKIAVISNTTDLHVKLNKERGLFKYFDQVVLSCEVGVTKPDEAIFKLMLKKLNLAPDECVFIDDRDSYVDAARKLGMHGIIFKNSAQFIRELKLLKVQTN